MGFGIEHTGIQSFLEPSDDKNALCAQSFGTGVVLFILLLLTFLFLFASFSKRNDIFVRLFRETKLLFF